jgi:hypothetical protein
VKQEQKTITHKRVSLSAQDLLDFLYPEPPKKDTKIEVSTSQSASELDHFKVLIYSSDSEAVWNAPIIQIELTTEEDN